MTTQEKFRSSIRRGTGEAYLIIKKNPSVDFSKEIIKASLKNFAYHPQLEGSRASYISGLIDLSDQKNKILSAIEKGIDAERKDTWALVQLFDLATIYARQGNAELRKAIYKRFYKKKIEGSGWVGYDSIFKLDGLAGLKYIATTIGKEIEKHSGSSEDKIMIQHFEIENPDIDAWRELQKESKRNRHIGNYLEAIRNTEKKRKKYNQPVASYNALTSWISSGKYDFVPLGYVRNLSKQEIKIAAHELLKETDNNKLANYLSIFSRIKFPFGYEYLLKLAERKSGLIASYATESLKFFSGKEIRDFALRQFSKSNSPWHYTDLLINNYKKSDHKLLTKFAQSVTNDDDVHQLACSFTRVFRENKTRDCHKPLMILYDKLSCGTHRRDLIEIMIQNKVLPQTISNEIRFDSNTEVRQLWNAKFGT